MVPPNSVKMFASEISTDIKNTGIVILVVQKLIFGGSRGHPQTMSKYLSVKYLLKKTGSLV